MCRHADSRWQSVALVFTSMLLASVCFVSCVRARAAPGGDETVAQRRIPSTSTGTLSGRHAIGVGKTPGPLLLVSDDRTLVCLNVGDHSVSLIDMSSRRETRRIRLPVRKKDEGGNETHGYLTGMAVDAATDTLWAVSSEGQIFSVDLETYVFETPFTDPRYEFSAVAWDPHRRRLLVAGEEAQGDKSARGTGELYAYRAGRMELLLATPLVIVKMQRSGSTLLYVCSADVIVDEGEWATVVGALDLETDRTIFDVDLAAGSAEDLAVLPEGRVWLADNGMNRLLEYSTTGELLITRHTGFDGAHVVSASKTRVVIALWVSGAPAVFEYGRVPGGFSPSPLWAYPVQDGTVSGILALPHGGIALTLHDSDQVLLLGKDTRRPFSGFPRS